MSRPGDVWLSLKLPNSRELVLDLPWHKLQCLRRSLMSSTLRENLTILFLRANLVNLPSDYKNSASGDFHQGWSFEASPTGWLF